MLRISFSHTAESVRQRTKLVTRRRAGTWKNLKPGQLLLGVEKLRGLKKGQSPEKLAVIRVLSVRLEPLKAITHDDLVLEALPGIATTEAFIGAYCAMNGELPDCETRRIEFEYVHWPGSQKWDNVLSGISVEESDDITLMDGPHADELLVVETAKKLRWHLAKCRARAHSGWNRPQLIPRANLVAALMAAIGREDWIDAAAHAATLDARTSRGLDVRDDQ